jgi:hypothetical protein
MDGQTAKRPLTLRPSAGIAAFVAYHEQHAGLPSGSLFPAEFLEVQPWSSPVLWGGGRGGACRLRPSPWRTKCADNAPALHRPNKKGAAPSYAHSRAVTLPVSIAENLTHHALPCSFYAGFHMRLLLIRTLHTLPCLIQRASTGAWVSRVSLTI